MTQSEMIEHEIKQAQIALAFQKSQSGRTALEVEHRSNEIQRLNEWIASLHQQKQELGGE